MHYRDLDLNLLIALHALLTTRSVSRAAERLHIGQPACSAALARLRDHFGDELLVTLNRRMLPTPLATQLERPVLEALARAEAISTRRPGFDPEVASQCFSIVCSDMVTRLVLSHVVRNLQELAPNISLMIRSTASLRSARMPVEEALDRGGADLLVLPARYIPRARPSLCLFSSDYSCIAWRYNRLVKENLTAELFYKLKHAALTFGDGRMTASENEESSESRRWRKFVVKSEYFLSLPAIVRGTDYIATLPTRLAVVVADQFDLRIFPAPIQIPPLNEVLVWPQHLHDDVANQWIRNFIVECAEKYLNTNAGVFVR